MAAAVPRREHRPHALHRQAHPGRALRSRRAGRLRDGDHALRRLVTIPISHYCEKARWALERAALDYREERHVQGVHQFASRRAGGHGTLPVLITEHGVFAGSEWIVRYADLHLTPEHRLFTGEPEVEALSRELDATLGADARRLIYAHMLSYPELMLPFNNDGVPAWEAVAITRLFALASRWARRELAIKDPDEDRRRVLATFDMVAARRAGSYLCGDRFTAADLTFATLAAAVVLPPQYGVALPRLEQLPSPVREDVAAFRAHPAGAYALELFERHRRRRPPES
jgi:glutathione S-transferase